MNEFFNIALPKWPGMLVVGETITHEQAQEIIIRTGHFPCSSNDREFEKEINTIMFGINCDSSELYDHFSFEDKEERLKKYGIIDLEYLGNRRILSSWVGGPYGWCNWDGEIFSDNTNIGKWPSIEEVYNEWCIIAKTFPFLNLKSQLLNCEICEAYEKQTLPVIEFIVENGNVAMNIPTTIITLPTDLTDEDFFNRFNNPYSERGCNIFQFSDALQYVRRKIHNETKIS